MSDLDNIKKLLAQGDKERAIKALILLLRSNSNDIEAWLLLGEIIDDPAKKRDCYNQVLKLSPADPIALEGLRSLDLAATSSNEGYAAHIQTSQPPKADTKDPRDPIQDLRANFQYKQSSKFADIFEDSKENLRGWGIVLLGVVGFFGASYILGVMLNSGDSSASNGDSFCMGVMCLGLIIGAFVWYSSTKAQNEVVDIAIQKQKQRQSGNASNYSSSSPNQVVLCRTCQHPVSRTAPVCPKCGELYPGLISECPFCGSKNLHITQKGFSLGKAAAGTVIAGPLGAAGGLHGRKDLEVTCSDCHRKFTIKHGKI